MFIYKTTNTITGKSYIGQHIGNNPNYLGSGVYLSRSIKFHGKENFTREIIEYCESREELNEMEFHYIKQYNTLFPTGYNLTEGGTQCNTNLCMSPEAKKERYRKQSIAVSGDNYYLNKMNPIERELYIKENRCGLNHSARKYKSEEEYQNFILETRCGNNNALKRNFKSEEEFQEFLDKKYRGDNHYLKKMSNEEYQEWQEKQRIGHMGLKHSEKTKAQMSNSQGLTEKGNKKKIVITLPFNNTELIIIGIGRFVDYINNLNILDYKVIRKNFGRVLSGKLKDFPKSHKGWKVREFDEMKDINIPKWENNLYIDELSMEGC